LAKTANRFTWRMGALIAFLVLATLAMVGRLAYIQILHHDKYSLEAQAEHLDHEPIRSSRGAILDRNGFPLATSTDAFDIYVDRRAWRPDAPNRPETVAKAIAPLLGKSEQEILANLTNTAEGPIGLVADEVDFDVGRQVQEMSLTGISVVATNKRFYPEGDVASGLIGFLGRDHKGLAGLEADLDDVLSGTPGSIYFERDSTGNPIAFGESRIEPGKPGSDVKLTIDRYIQRLIDTELDKQIQEHQATGGTIIVMDPKTGAILGMASRPSFKLSQLSLDANPSLDLFRNRAVTDVYEPGSVVKTFTMAAGIDKGLVTPGTTYYDSGVVVKGGYTFRNWDFSANGIQTMVDVLQKSLNTGAIFVSDLLGPDNLYKYLKLFGFGESTNSGLGGEASGLLRTNQDPNWYPADLATNSFGQGMAATPLQVITAFASVINGGKLMRPYVIQEIDGPTGRRVYEPVMVRQTISPAASKTMVSMLEQVVDGNPVHLARVKGYHVGGKTGTTLVSIPTGYALDSTIASFVGFAPVEDPAFIMLVKIDQPKDDPLGGIVAAPVFGKLAPQILSYLNIPPYDSPLAQAGR
jgi:cell division protein FtsI/penicillin-binding protein 2